MNNTQSNTPERLSAEEMAKRYADNFEQKGFSGPYCQGSFNGYMQGYNEARHEIEAAEKDRDDYILSLRTARGGIIHYKDKAKQLESALQDETCLRQKVEKERDQLREQLKEVTRQRDELKKMLIEVRQYLDSELAYNSISYFLSQLENEKKDE